MGTPVIVEAVRTPVGKRGGALSGNITRTAWPHAWLPYAAGCRSRPRLARIVAQCLVSERRGAGIALITMCAGGAMATATILERL